MTSLYAHRPRKGPKSRNGRQPVPFFSQDPANAGATATFGQPALSSQRHVLFASNRGLFVYGLN
jgi:hypothetical protein